MRRPTLAALMFSAACSGYAQGLDKQVATLTEKIGATLVAKKKTKLAVADFSDLQGRATEFGRFLAEQLSVEFVNTPGISVMDRAHFKKILAEHKLGEEGLIDPQTAKKLGQFIGVDVIIIGTVTTLDEDMVVTAKAIATDTAEIVAANKVTLVRTKETQQLVARALGAPRASSESAAGPIATKDFGDLRIALIGVRRASAVMDYRQLNGIECSFEFSNRNLKERLLCAANGMANYTSHARAHIRATDGSVLNAREVRGLTTVCVYGHYAEASGIAQIITTGQRIAQARAYHQNERLWQGDLTSIPPGETIRVSVMLMPDERAPSIASADDLHLSFEVVVGTGTRRLIANSGADAPNQVRLHTFTVDNLSLGKKTK